jgi:hypothetical protein
MHGKPKWLTICGLVLTLLGAASAAYGVWLSPDQAIERGVSRVSGDLREQDLHLPAVQNLLEQSHFALAGFVLIGLGTFLQITGVVAGARHVSDEEDYQTSLLRQQIRVARWLNGITAIAAAFALLTVIVLVVTLRDAQKSTQDVNRAFAYFGAPEVNYHVDPARHIKSWQFMIGIGNSGNTPTKRLLYYVGCVEKIGDVDKFFETKPTRNFLLGPKVMIKPNACTVEIPDATAKPNNIFYITGTLTYNDIIDTNVSHRTEACYTMDFSTGNSSDLSARAGPCETGRNHNCMDDECTGVVTQ